MVSAFLPHVGGRELQPVAHSVLVQGGLQAGAAADTAALLHPVGGGEL